MSKPSIACGLDIGTGAVKILIAKTTAPGSTEAIYIGQHPSKGIRRGVIVNIEEAAKCIANVVHDAELVSGVKINGVYTNIGGAHVFCTSSHGLVSVSRADSSISEEDVERVLLAAKTISLSSNKEIIDVYPREFIVDGEGGVKDAVGMRGVRLETDAIILAGFAPYLKNLDQVLFKADLEILDRVPSAIAGALSALTPRQKELGTALVDIGAGTTSIAVYEDGDLIHFSVLPIGSANITNDIAIGLQIDIETAEKIKIEHGICLFKGADKKIKIEDSQKKYTATFSQRTVSKIIADRIAEIFEMANKELKKINRAAKLPAGIVLAGGGAKLSGIVEIAKKEFHLSCRLAECKGIAGIDQDLALVNVCGLALLDMEEKNIKSGTHSLNNSTGFVNTLKKIIKAFAP